MDLLRQITVAFPQTSRKCQVPWPTNGTWCKRRISNDTVPRPRSPPLRLSSASGLFSVRGCPPSISQSTALFLSPSPPDAVGDANVVNPCGTVRSADSCDHFNLPPRSECPNTVHFSSQIRGFENAWTRRSAASLCPVKTCVEPTRTFPLSACPLSGHREFFRSRG